jgi:hypothetical protein
MRWRQSGGVLDAWVSGNGEEEEQEAQASIDNNK